ncbi:MAG TPA: hypothetical protein PLP07_01810 [Pyrinomonadaceae bacterium]|nr:hypothetical protein [Chloracidobacterium sp.]MBP9934433.1 hypothetical protein [Pyrinomonadaceae bacterium]MBK7802587.1 hypothetical protein [Chloracidobacterium sp.]MBK9437439.1 hypothetical protein [Chloracidobacterium sp.]MBL0240109.1 hypothetical protein [Chloracidobacterium sp.]
MDAFHKILVRIYEITGGRDSVDVDMVELTKKEGYFPSIDSITEMLKSESWVTESRPNTVRITHWGVAEAKRSHTARPDAARSVERDAKKLHSESRDLGVFIEEFIADPSKLRFASVSKKFGEMERLVASIGDTL